MLCTLTAASLEHVAYSARLFLDLLPATLAEVKALPQAFQNAELKHRVYLIAACHAAGLRVISHDLAALARVLEGVCVLPVRSQRCYTACLPAFISLCSGTGTPLVFISADQRLSAAGVAALIDKNLCARASKHPALLYVPGLFQALL
jgi:hypothetical protein